MKRLPIVAVSAFLLITVIVLGQTWWPEGSRPLQGDNQTKSTIKVNQILYDSQQGTKPLSVSGSFTGTVNTISNVFSTYAGQTARLDVNQTNVTTVVPGAFTYVFSGDTNVVCQLTNTSKLIRFVTLTAYSNYVANAGNVWVGTTTNGPFFLLNSSTGPWTYSVPANCAFVLSNVYARSEATNQGLGVHYAEQP